MDSVTQSEQPDTQEVLRNFLNCGEMTKQEAGQFFEQISLLKWRGDPVAVVLQLQQEERNRDQKDCSPIYFALIRKGEDGQIVFLRDPNSVPMGRFKDFEFNEKTYCYIARRGDNLECVISVVDKGGEVGVVIEASEGYNEITSPPGFGEYLLGRRYGGVFLLSPTGEKLHPHPFVVIRKVNGRFVGQKIGGTGNYRIRVNS